MQNIKVPDDNRWENCAYARNLPKLQHDPTKYVMTKRNEFHLCGICAARLAGGDLNVWMSQKKKAQQGDRFFLRMNLKDAREYAMMNVRMSWC